MKEIEVPNAYNKNIAQREPLICWECSESHYFKDCHVRMKNINNVHTIQEDTTMGDIARSVPRISTALENRQANLQTSMVEIEGMLKDKLISILIDRGASLSYISLRIVE